MDFGDVVLVDLPPVGGHEQAGQRPAIVVQAGGSVYDRLSTVVVVPLTSQVRAQHYPGSVLIEQDEGNRLRNASVAIVFQIRVIDRRRVMRRIGRLSEDDLVALRDELRRLLTLE